MVTLVNPEALAADDISDEIAATVSGSSVVSVEIFPVESLTIEGRAVEAEDDDDDDI